MGCDIHTWAERRDLRGEWVQVAPDLDAFGGRRYSAFGFLADVRNYSAVPQITERRGLPDDVSPATTKEYDWWEGEAHSASWLSLEELLAFDYDASLEDRRADGGNTCPPGHGEWKTFREFLGHEYFEDLRALQEAGAERIVFWFDN